MYVMWRAVDRTATRTEAAGFGALLISAISVLR